MSLQARSAAFSGAGTELVLVSDCSALEHDGTFIHLVWIAFWIINLLHKSC